MSWLFVAIVLAIVAVSGLLTLWSAHIHRCQGVSGPCGRWDSRVRPCMTAYEDMSRNVAPRLCDDCAEEYRDYWDEMWREYYGGLL
jgi:hypothetical protein